MNLHNTPNYSIDELTQKAMDIRCGIITTLSQAKAGHSGGSLSAVDIVTALYFRVMRIDPQNPKWDERDRFILSKGHACPVLYVALAEKGYFEKSHLQSLRSINSILQGHPDMRKTPGVDMSTGSLGQGLSAGLGMALSAKMLGKDYRVWVLLGDGELQEGSVWEAAMAAAKWKLDNITAIVDYNRLQSDGFVADLMPIEPLADKWRAFGWQVTEIDGHNMGEIVTSLEDSKINSGFPKIIIAHTTKGKGVSFMENITEWHGKPPCPEEAEQALLDIKGGF